jgi:uncharacterized protein (TIGR02246 family)
MNNKEDEQEIRKLVETWMSASKEGDIKTVLSLMTNDVIFMIPGQKPFGKEEFASVSRRMNDMVIKGRSDIKEIKIFGDWAYMRNFIEINITSPENVTNKSGYTLTILRKESGRWKVARDANLVMKT